jgi:hypothetical protein
MHDTSTGKRNLKQQKGLFSTNLNSNLNSRLSRKRVQSTYHSKRGGVFVVSQIADHKSDLDKTHPLNMTPLHKRKITNILLNNCMMDLPPIRQGEYGGFLSAYALSGIRPTIQHQKNMSTAKI